MERAPLQGSELPVTVEESQVFTLQLVIFAIWTGFCFCHGGFGNTAHQLHFYTFCLLSLTQDISPSEAGTYLQSRVTLS